nr:hypothetical protein [Candidatus Sigynarchaeota archaeon]
MPGKDKDKKSAPSVVYVVITIQQKKKKEIVEQKEKTDNEGIVEVRTHSKKESTSFSDGKTKVQESWKTTEYRIPLFKLGLKPEASKSEILNVLNNPQHIANKTVAEILKKCRDDYGGVKSAGFSSKYHFKTE